MKKSVNESENDGPNLYLRLFQEKVKLSDKISLESIENLFSNMTNLHNTVGKSYEHVATLLGTLLSQLKQQKSQDEEKDQQYEAKLKQMALKVEDVQKELIQTKDKNQSLSKELEHKEMIIQSMKSEIDQLKKKLAESIANQAKKIAEKMERQGTESNHFENKFEEMKNDYQNSNKNENSRGGFSDGGNKKRKTDDKNVNALQYAIHQQKEEEEEGNLDENMEIDKFKFKKIFKKVKKTNENTENSPKHAINYTISINYEGQNPKNTHKEDTMAEEMLLPDEDIENNDLKDLLNNFNASKTNEKRAIAPVVNPSDQVNKKNNLDPSSGVESTKKIAKEKIKESKVYKKETNLAFTQQGPINDSLERELFPEFGGLPITTKDRGSQIMQKMIKSNQKRNNMSLNSYFKTETQSTRFSEASEMNKENTKDDKPEMKDEKPVRGTHRTKNERENLQGFECDQCQKVISK